ncbi:response regulator transcription factor [Paraburkholderia pallida]|uniref:Response regulator transcription factor n=1 Tax=Paraburkholderia pallida TaxID=2547399 RepID=A0A4P7D084_9BURK|nr:response regulator transcription factor [Paraburkholderia pallida]QBQ99831.1 response regulator transcription factor [Paraburkholderia pallida]
MLEIEINAHLAGEGNGPDFPSWTAIRVLGVGQNKALFDRFAAAPGNEGLLVEVADTARNALFRVMDGGCDLVIVKDGWPELDGAKFVATMRTAGLAVPVLVIDTVGSVERCVHALRCGADDYLTQPVDLEELSARVLALLRRRMCRIRVQPFDRTAPSTTLHGSGIVLDRITRVVTVDSTAVTLRPTEFRLLEYLMVNQDRIVTRRMLLEKVWRRSFDPCTNVIDVHIKQLRLKLNDPDGVRYIKTIRGAGYKFTSEASVEVPP